MTIASPDSPDSSSSPANSTDPGGPAHGRPSGSPANPDDLDRLALGTLLPAFEGQQAPGWIRRMLGEGLAGVILFGPNIVSDQQLQTLTGELREGGNPLICLDEEGGDVTRISYHAGSRYPGNAALGLVDDVDLTHSVYHAIGADLARLGVNLDLAPCADVNTEDENPVIGTRAFGTDPKLVARHTSAAVRGLQQAGIAACVKHFPGHGATRQDSHNEIPTVDADLDLLQTRELVPFRAAIDAGSAALMSAHVRVPVLTGDQPATLSAAALRDLARHELRFDGVVISDALDMKAITESSGLAEGAVRTLEAGTDLLCLGPIPSEHDVTEIVGAIGRAVQQGRLRRSRLEESAARVARLKQWLASSTTLPSPSTDVGLIAARRALRPFGGLPGDQRPVQVLELQSPPTIAVGEVPWGLSTVLDGVARLDPTAAPSDDELAAVVADRRVVLVVRDVHRNPETRELLERLLRLRPDAVLVEMGLPIWRPSNGQQPAYLATYGAGRVNARAAAEYLGLANS